LEALALTSERARVLDGELAKMGLGQARGDLPTDFPQQSLTGLLRIDTVSPAGFPALDGDWKVPDSWNELDFDGADSFPQGQGAEARFADVYHRHLPDEAGKVLRRANQLAIRLRYFYELRIPFANRVIFTAWLASNAGHSIAKERGFDPVTKEELDLLRRLATSSPRRFFIPLTATHGMQMQSNFYRKWLMHERPGWDP
jgi:hypothetical protein